MSKNQITPISLRSNFPPLGTLERLEQEETRIEAMRLAEKLRGLTPEEQIGILAKVDLTLFRELVKIYKPPDWVIDRILGRKIRGR